MNAIHSAACQLKDALYVAMSDADAKPVRISFSPTAATVVDICSSDDEEDGQAWVGLINARPTSNDNFPCGTEREVMFVMGISRCAHTLDDAADPPSAEELNEDFAKLTRDYKIFQRAITELFVPEMDLDKGAYRIGDYDVHPVRGGCLVATQELFVRFSCV